MDVNLSTSSTMERTESSAGMSSISWAITALLGLASYAWLCSFLRFRRINKLRSRLGFIDRASLSRMTVTEAQEIIQNMICYEFPIMYDLSLRIGFFRTYTIEYIAKLLIAHSDLAKRDQAPKRYEDTSILFTCFVLFPPQSDEYLKAVARVNALHGPYVNAGKILNRDLLYVLWTSMADPGHYMNQYEWRGLTDMEIAALGTLWKHTGDLMKIDCRKELGNDEWQDGIECMEELERWAAKHEDAYMRPLPEVYKIGEVLMSVLLDSYPKFIRPILYRMSLVVMGERMRRAFGLPEPSLGFNLLTYGLLYARMLFMRYLALPRVFPVKYFSEPNAQTGRIHSYQYLNEPWYVPPTLGNRWSLEALITRISGGMLPGDGGAKMKPEGFLFEDFGPKRTMGKPFNEEEMERLVKLSHARSAPFAHSNDVKA